MTKTDELKNFVTDQAKYDARLKPSEKRYQTDLVKDVLKQEVSNSKLFNELFSQYRSQVASR